MFPHLFPEHAAFGWVREPQYELPNVAALQRQIAEVEAAAREKTETLTQAITAERAKWEFLHELLRETGDPLLEAVQTALGTIGFKDVRNSDKLASGGRKWEDLQVHDRSPVLLVEIKGVAGTGTEHDAIQVGKYLAPRMKEWNRTDVSGVSIINHQRNLPGLDRSTSPFTDVVLENALSQGFGLMTTWDLFRLVRNFLQLGWKPEDLQPLFYQAGRIDAVPAHYEFVGVIEKYFERPAVVGISVSGAALRQGDQIAFELPIDFIEQDVNSLEVERKSVGGLVPNFETNG